MNSHAYESIRKSITLNWLKQILLKSHIHVAHLLVTNPLFDFVWKKRADHGKDGTEKNGLVYQMDAAYFQRKGILQKRFDFLFVGLMR